MLLTVAGFFFFQAEDGIRDLVRSRGLGDVYKRQGGGFEPHIPSPLAGLVGFWDANHGLRWSVLRTDLSLIHI